MPQYAPLPPIDLDPRNESELVAAAAQRVYEASGATINDFSSGSPVMALLEGQAFAQAELLAFANSFPEAVLVEWIGPFLGAQRRTGAGSVVELEFTIAPRDQSFVIFPGFEVSTDSNLTGGVSVSFVTTGTLTIPAGESTGRAQAVAILRGVAGNVPANTITNPVTSLEGIEAVTNPEAAVGGQDPELLQEVKERFFTLIRRRNPVSAEDWVDFFSDALGPGAVVNVLPRRSSQEQYNYELDYVNAEPSVAFFVLNRDGSPLTSAQRSSLQNLIKYALPTEFTGTVYSMEVDDADVVLDLQYDPNRPYAQDLQNFTRTVRNNLFGVLTPNAVFPVTYAPSVSDVESALTTSFPLTLGTTQRYIDPDVASMSVYSTPRGIQSAAFSVLAPQSFETGTTLKTGDLVVDGTSHIILYYQVLEDFTPVTGSKSYEANIGNLGFEIIRKLEPGTYNTGQVITPNDGLELRVVLADFTFDGNRTVNDLFATGLISGPKGFSNWAVGTTILATVSGTYDPQLISFESSDLSTEVYEPRTPQSVSLNRRPGYPVWVAKQNFEVTANLSDIGTAQQQGYIATQRTEVDLLFPGDTFTTGQFVVTPTQEQFLTGFVPEDSCYLDRQQGIVQVFAKVLTDFTFPSLGDRTYKQVVDDLVEAGILKVIQVVDYVDCAGRPLFTNKSFRYNARFSLGEYLRYRSEGGFDATELETCFLLAESCPEVPSSCRRLLEANLPLPRYFQALVDFTPTSTDPDELVNAGLIAEVSPTIFRYNYVLERTSLPSFFTASLITDILIQQGKISSASDLVVGQTVLVSGPMGENFGTYYWNGIIWDTETGGIPTYRDMFRFAPKDTTSVRNGSTIRQYEAKEHVTPIMDLRVYYDNGVFVRSDRPENVRYYDPSYRYEDVILASDSSSQKFYRVTRSFTPPDEVETWAGLQVNTPRAEEVFGNLLKFSVLATCEQHVYPRLGYDVSANKLGSATIRVTSKSNTAASYTYVWESSAYATDPPQLSYYPQTQFAYGPVNYGTGTLAL